MTDGFALILDPHGKILNVVESTGEFVSAADVGTLFILKVDKASKKKFFEFVMNTRTRKTSYNWEINVGSGRKLRSVFLSGILDEGNLILIGAFTKDAMYSYLEDMAAINNDFSNKVRHLLAQLRTKEKEKIQALDELTEMNNQLVNLQRDLQLKNKMLDQQSKVLEKLNEDKNRFLGMAAHDLRNPIGVIMNLSQLMLDAGAELDVEEAAEFARIIHESSRFMSKLLEDLLDLSVIESGNLRLHREREDIVEVIRRNVRMNDFAARKKEISLSFEAPCEAFMVEIDRNKMDQVINNLVSNAIKFSHRESCIEVGLKIEPGECIVSVRDSGQGIPQEELENIFGAFRTTSTKSTEGEKSTGLGLMIAHKIIQGHEGRIWATSELGKGSTFLIAIPHDNDVSGMNLAASEVVDTALAEVEQNEDAVTDVDDRIPLTVVSATDCFGDELEQCFPGRFRVQYIRQAKELLLRSRDKIESDHVFIDCRGIDMTLPVLLSFAQRTRIPKKIILYRFEPDMLDGEELNKYEVHGVVSAGESLGELAELRTAA